jgi:hypothetical protein
MKENPSKFEELREMEMDANRMVDQETGMWWQRLGDEKVPIYDSVAQRRVAERRGKLRKPSRRFTIRLPSGRR